MLTKNEKKDFFLEGDFLNWFGFKDMLDETIVV